MNFKLYLMVLTLSCISISNAASFHVKYYVETNMEAISFEAETEDFQSFEIQKLPFDISLVVSQLKSGIGLRDTHTYQKIFKDKSGNSKIRAKVIESDCTAEKSTCTVLSSFNVAGSIIQKKLEFKKESNLLKSGTNFSLSKFGIKAPSYMGVTVEDLVRVEISIKL
ncbi:hypothetical protein N9O57_01480 [bacterium]|nr:hypothetical protein [bacterium]